jgi:hypothetical protein
MPEPRPWRYNDHYWNVFELFGWILDRDISQFGSIASRQELNQARFYDKKGNYRADNLAHKELEHALKCGKLNAYLHGELKAAHWWSEAAHLEHCIKGIDVYSFKSTQAKMLWPLTRRTDSPHDSEGSAAKRGPRPVMRLKAAQAMREAIREGKYTSETLSQMKQEALALEFCGKTTGRETAIEARKLVLSESEFVGVQDAKLIPANSGTK